MAPPRQPRLGKLHNDVAPEFCRSEVQNALLGSQPWETLSNVRLQPSNAIDDSQVGLRDRQEAWSGLCFASSIAMCGDRMETLYNKILLGQPLQFSSGLLIFLGSSLWPKGLRRTTQQNKKSSNNG
jgi:hypothetical protein